MHLPESEVAADGFDLNLLAESHAFVFQPDAVEYFAAKDPHARLRIFEAKPEQDAGHGGQDKVPKPADRVHIGTGGEGKPAGGDEIELVTEKELQ